MARETPVHITSGEDLLGADPAVAAEACIAFPTGGDRRNHDLFSDPTLRLYPGFHHRAADLVAQG